MNTRARAIALIVSLLLGLAGVAAAHDAVVDEQATRGLQTPPGFFDSPWMAVPAPTSLEWSPFDGDLYVTSHAGAVYRIAPLTQDQNYLPTPPVVFATGLERPLGIAIADDGTVFVSHQANDAAGAVVGEVVAFDADGGNRRVVITGLPNGRHNTNDMAIGPDGMLYIPNGNSTDDGVECGPEVVAGVQESPEACRGGETEVKPWSGSLLRVDPAATGLSKEDATVIATGMRNPYDVAFHPVTGEAWVPVNGPDNPASDDVLYALPTDSRRTDDLGFPSCLYNAHTNAGIGGETDDHHEHGHSLEPMDNLNPAVIEAYGHCDTKRVTRPIATFGGHVSANGIDFAHGSGFMGTYQNDVFVAEWGNIWGVEDGHVSGHKIVRINLRDDGSIVEHAHDGTSGEEHHAVDAVTEFATGGLPIDIAFGNDGAMYVADMGGMIRRIAQNAGAVPPDDEGVHDDGHGHQHDDGHDAGATPDTRYECPVEEQTGADVFEEHYDYETGRKECVVFYTNPTDPDQGQYGSWDPGTQDDDPNYSSGDRGQRWGMNNAGPEAGEDGHHHGDHDPMCSQAAQDELLQRARTSLARYDGAEGVARATDEGYYFYPIATKVYHAFNTSLYDDADPVTGVQRDLVPEYPENIIYAMTDDGMKAMGIMFALGWDEARDRSWKDYESFEELPKFTTSTLRQPEQCNMLWHSHTGTEGLATSFDSENPDESVPMAHVWAWGIDMWERGMDGTEPNSWWAPYRMTPAICSEKDACL